MSGENTTKKFTSKEIAELRRNGQSKTDFVALERQSEQEVERSAIADLQENGLPADWHLRAAVVASKVPISIRLDADLVEYFRGQGPGWQTRINNALRAFREASEGVGS